MNTADNIDILHASPNTLVSAGLKAILAKGGGIGKICSVHNTEDLQGSIGQHKPQLLVIDFSEPGPFSKKVVARIRKDHPDIKVLLISSMENTSEILAVLETGVHGYLTGECDEGEIINAVFSIAKGEKFYCNKVINVILDKKLSPEAEDDCDPTSLTERETEVTTLIAQGNTNKEIAAKLFISQHTVNTHRKNIMKKLGTGSTTGLVLYAVNAGLVEPGQAAGQR